MVHEVEIHGLRGKSVERIGTITFDDEAGTFATIPENDETLRRILATPIRLAGNHVVDAQAAPVKFMENLNKQYASYALTASKVVGLPKTFTTNEYATYEIGDVPYAENVP